MRLRKDKRLIYLRTLMITFGLVLGIIKLRAQDLHAIKRAVAWPSEVSTWFGILELPFLSIAVFFAFRTASALKGGLFGRGMALMAWGFLVMAFGHVHMQLEHFLHYNLFAKLFGTEGGAAMWFIALVVTWALSGLGFYKIYAASKAG